MVARMIYGGHTDGQRFSAGHALRDPRTHGPLAAVMLTSVSGAALAVGAVALVLISSSKVSGSPLTTSKASVDVSYQNNPRGAANPHAIIYGRTVVGGAIFYDEVTDGNKYMHRCVAMAGHECDAIETVYFDDEALTLDGSGEITAPSKWVGKARIKTHLGDQTTADADLVAESDGLWTSAHVGNGICYIYGRFLFDRDAFPRGVPVITAKIRGKKVYDPRTELTVWTDNAALCMRDYITSSYGLKANNVDDTNYSVAANACDESVSLAAGGTENRYTVNGSFTTTTAPRGIIASLSAAMAGYLIYGQGEWKAFPGVYTAATKTLDEDDLRSSIKVSPRHARSVNFNSVRGLFSGAETNWKETDYPPIESATFLTEDNGFANAADLNLPFTGSGAMAQRIAKISLYRNREQITVTAVFGMSAFDVETGDNIQFTYERFGWTTKEFECVGWKFVMSAEGEPTVELILREISSSVFDWSADEAAFVLNNTNLPDAFITAAAGTAITNELRSINEKVLGVLIVDVTSSVAGFVQQFEVQARKSADSDWTNLGVASGKRFELLDVEDTTYDIRARTINSFGVRGDWSQTDDYLVTAFADPPNNVTNFDINVLNGMAHLTWDAVTDLDLSYYVIRHAPVTAGGAYSAASTVAPKVPRPATSIALPYRDGTYFIRAVDKVGNESVTPSSIITNISAVEGLNAVQTVTESTGFTGTKSGLIVDTGTLKITDTSTAPTSGTYDFATVVDLGDKYTSRVQAHVEFIRDDATGDLFDAATGLFDSRAGLFDGGEFTDVNVVMQVALTDDDTTISPTWSAWKDFTVGDFSARGLKFRSVLSTTSNNVGPKINTLSVSVDMPDRVIAEADVVSGAGAKIITFSPAFKTLLGVGISAQGMTTGDYYDITSKSAAGFTIHFKDSAAASISRTFDYIARGYGKVI
jgi:hypothetical protein